MGIDRTEISPALQAKLVFAGANLSSFEYAHRAASELMDVEVSTKQIERLTERAGRERCAERDAAVTSYMSLPLAERKDKPPTVTAPEAVAVIVDGGRLQILDRSEKKTAAADVEAEEALLPDEQHRGTHWYEDKIASCLTLSSQECQSDPCPEIPEMFVDPSRMATLTRELKTKKAARVEERVGPAPATAAGGVGAAEDAAVATKAAATAEDAAAATRAAEWVPPQVTSKEFAATRRPWALFGPMVAYLAWSLGFYASKRKAFVADGADNNWTLWRNHFSSFTPILDIIHAISYVYAAALAGRSFAEGWVCYARWVRWVWAGEVAKVVEELAARQGEVGVPEDGDCETHVRQIVHAALRYLRNHGDKMKYNEYRRQGLPITSSYVESAVKQFNQRVKGTEKFWSEPGAEAVLQLRGDYLSHSRPMDGYWLRRQESAIGLRNYNYSLAI